MPDSVSPQAVLQAIAELRQWVGELGQVAGTLSDFAFKWAEQNGGVPKTKAARDKLLADYRARFDPQPEVPDEQAMQAMEERYQAWAKERGIETATPADVQRFDDETGVLTRRIDELSGFTGPKDLAHRIGARLDELSRDAVALGCDDATAAALKGAAALTPDIAEGRAVLDHPATWTEARRQANAMFQSEAIAGIPLNRPWEVALDKLEQAALSQAESCAGPDLSGVLQGMDDQHGLALPELARQLPALAGDVEAASYVSDALRHNAADLSQAARLQFRDTSMDRREVEPGRWQWIKRDSRNRPLDERRLEHHLCQALAVLSDLQDGRKAADTPTKLRAIAKGIEQAAPKSADPQPTAQADPPVIPGAPINGTKALSKEAKALAALADHPDWTDEQIAQAAGCNRQSLYRMKKYVAAKRMLKGGKDLMPSGSKDGESGDVEAWDTDGDDE